ncbi:hypothetical protein Tco_0982162, partial [Tanacetum coccineum]
MRREEVAFGSVADLTFRFRHNKSCTVFSHLGALRAIGNDSTTVPQIRKLVVTIRFGYLKMIYTRLHFELTRAITSLELCPLVSLMLQPHFRGEDFILHYLPDLGEITYAFENLIMNEIFESAFEKKFP